MTLNLHRKQFQSNWQRFTQRYLLSSSVAHSIYACLVEAYQEPQRAYHSLQHINECMALLHQVEHLLEDAFAVELALWFHDAVYDPQAQNNEAQSAVLMQQMCQPFLNLEQMNKITIWILATAQHQASEDADLNILLDIDLAILGTDELRFTEYEQQIRTEYNWVDAQIYQQKRAAVLRHFYELQPIYQTPYFYERLEIQAKFNLSSALL